MITKRFPTILFVCLSAAFVLPPLANGQTPGVIISANIQSVALGPIPILRCEEGLHLFGATSISSVKAVTGPLTLVKNVDYISELLRQAMVFGTRLRTVNIGFLLPNPAPQPPQRLMYIVLLDAAIAEIVLTAGDAAAVETVKFQYDKACWRNYFEQGANTFCWDFKAGRVFDPPQDVIW